MYTWRDSLQLLGDNVCTLMIAVYANNIAG